MMYRLHMKDGTQGPEVDSDWIQVCDLSPEVRSIEVIKTVVEVQKTVYRSPLSVGFSGAIGPQDIQGIDGDADMDVVIMGASDSTMLIEIVRCIRHMTGMGLKESKGIADKAFSNRSSVIAKDVSQHEAFLVKAMFEKVGCRVELHKRPADSPRTLYRTSFSSIPKDKFEIVSRILAVPIEKVWASNYQNPLIGREKPFSEAFDDWHSLKAYDVVGCIQEVS